MGLRDSPKLEARLEVRVIRTRVYRGSIVEPPICGNRYMQVSRSGGRIRFLEVRLCGSWVFGF